jgi:hypothetical protein
MELEEIMIKIQIIDETGIDPKDLSTIVDGLNYFIPLVTKPWGQQDMKAGTNNGDWKVYITERNRKLSALGYHTIESNIPTAYVSHKANPNLWGRYIKPLVVKGKQIHGATWQQGLITVLCHEIAEMICDPAISNYSAQDAKGRNWLIEVCDHVYGSYSQSTFNGKVCIFPDVTTPEFYKLNSIAPYSIFHGALAPFTMTAKGYAYYKDSTGKLIKI